MDTNKRHRWERAYPYLVSAGMLGLMLAPIVRRPPVDSFPLSTYPMFSHGRRDAMTTVERAVGRMTNNERRPIPPRLVGTEEVLQARAIVAQSIRAGTSSARKLCAEIAARVGREEAFADVSKIEIRTDTFDAVAFFDGYEDPVSSRMHALCKVTRP